MEDVVVLVPGFFGFARFGGFYYFAERLITVLRGSLESSEGTVLPVVPVTTLPTHSLHERQQALLENLASLMRRLDGVQSIHLIGHSTGGVDAQLITCTRNFHGKPWDERWEEVRSRIRSVITISSPHHGTELADSQFALLGKNPLQNPGAIIAGARALAGLLRLAPRYLAANVGFDLASPNDLLKFFWQVIRNRDLIDDLKPASMERVRARLSPDPNIRLMCFVTSTLPRNDSLRRSDPFFADLYRLTEGSGKVSERVLQCTRFLKEQVQQRPELVIRGHQSEMAGITPTLNDGVVNAVRQIVNPDVNELGGFIVADHADSLGHYDLQDSLIGGRPYNAGLFRSGAGFGDDQFFAVYWRIAQVILGTRERARAKQRNPRNQGNERSNPGRLNGIDANPTAPAAASKRLLAILRGETKKSNQVSDRPRRASQRSRSARGGRKAGPKSSATR
jgi:pimeloyl-ACP methyl ester carboxylesterase